MHEIKIEQFQGPLDLLLQLIEKDKLDITQFSLVKVTNQYLEYLEKDNLLTPEELSDFLIIATKLLLIKSKAILPVFSTDNDDEIYDLEKQLKTYKKYAQASIFIQSIYSVEPIYFPRQSSENFKNLKKVFIPPKNIDKEILRKIFLIVLKNLQPLIKPPKNTLRRIISLQEKIIFIKNIIQIKQKIKLGVLFKESFDKSEMIINFLAILSLIKENSIQAEQENIFQDILITRK